MSEPEANPIVLYDGVCGLCNRLVQFILKHDYNDRFRFAALQSDFSFKLLSKHGHDPHDLDTVYLVKNYNQSGEDLLMRSDAILYTLNKLGGIWSLSVIGRLIPRALRDVFYKIVARNRYSIFGKHESCMLPEPKYRAKFLDV